MSHPIEKITVSIDVQECKKWADELYCLGCGDHTAVGAALIEIGEFIREHGFPEKVFDEEGQTLSFVAGYFGKEEKAFALIKGGKFTGQGAKK